MNRHAKKIRKDIIDYIKEQREEYGISDYTMNADFYDGFDLGIRVILDLMKEAFNGEQ